MSNKVIEYSNSLPTDFDSMEPEKVYFDDASDYGIMRTSNYSLYIIRKEHFFLTPPDNMSEVMQYIDREYSCQSHVSGKLYIGFTKDKSCCYPQDSIKRVSYFMAEAGIKEFQVKQFGSMMEALNYIRDNNLDTVEG